MLIRGDDRGPGMTPSSPSTSTFTTARGPSSSTKAMSARSPVPITPGPYLRCGSGAGAARYPGLEIPTSRSCPKLEPNSPATGGGRRPSRPRFGYLERSTHFVIPTRRRASSHPDVGQQQLRAHAVAGVAGAAGFVLSPRVEQVGWNLRRSCLGCAAIGVAVVAVALGLLVWLLLSADARPVPYPTPDAAAVGVESAGVPR